MKSILLSLILLATHIHAMQGAMSIADGIGLYTQAKSACGFFGQFLPQSFTDQGTLSRVTFKSQVIAPQLLERSTHIAASLSIDDLEVLQNSYLTIQDRIGLIAQNQGIESHTPLLVQLKNNNIATCLTKYASTIYSFVGMRDVDLEIKEGMVTEMLNNFITVGKLSSIIDVSKFRRNDTYRVDEIRTALDKMKPIIDRARKV
jgi:hypothetical protein